jgi:hypothetical protein
MSQTDEYRRPALSRFVLEYLGVAPGPVNDIFVVKNMFCSTTDGLFAAQHVLRTLVSSIFRCIVNQTTEAQLIVRCSIPSDVERLDGENVTFKFDDKFVRFYKIFSVSVAPDEEDVTSHPDIKPFPAFIEGNTVVGYPRGFSDENEDMDNHLNPYIALSTMEALNLGVGDFERMLKVNVKYMNFPGIYLYAIHVIPFKGLFDFAIDQDGSMYVKFNQKEHADYMASMHFFFARRMFKFYKLTSLNKKSNFFDKSVCSKIYWRRCTTDQWKEVNG